MSERWNARLLGALAAMSWLGPTPFAAVDVAQLLEQDARHRRRRAKRPEPVAPEQRARCTVATPA